MNGQIKLKCRLCDKDITEKNSLLLYDYHENIETRLGRKINIILNTTGKHEDLSNYCCQFCSCKIEICFGLLVEIQASDEVIKQTYENLSNGKKVDTSNQLFICGECKTTVVGIKLFIKHYENHILRKTTVGSKKGRAVTSLVPYKTKEEILENIKNLIGLGDESNTLNDLNECDVPLEFVSVNDNSKDFIFENKFEPIDRLKGEVDDNSSSDLNLSSLDECTKDCDDFVNMDDPELVEIFSDNEYNEVECNNDLDLETMTERNNFDEIEFDSENSNDLSESSEMSYENLVTIVKRELEKSDDDDEGEEDDDFRSLSPNEDGRYACNNCNLIFEYKFILILHLKSDHKEFHEYDISNTNGEDEEEDINTYLKCCYCKKSFLSPVFKDHLLECREQYSHYRKTLCQYCGKMCSFRNLEKHMAEHEQKEGYTCDSCGKKFKAKRFLKSHLGEHDESKKKICEICGKKLLPLSFFSHIIKHREKRHVCQYCGKAFTHKYGLKSHFKVHEGGKKMEMKPEKKKEKVFCWLCKTDYDSTSALTKHLKTEHNVESVEQDSRFPCSHCDKKFADMFSLKAHLKLIHEMKDEEIARLKSLPVYRYIECNVCQKAFNSENKIRIHMKQDHGLKPFEMEILKKECEKCGKKFASKQNLIHHINGAHLNIKPMTCDICQEKFAKHSSLIYHKLRHSGEKPFQCEFCQKSYRQRNDVIRHLARHVRDKELTLEEASAVNNSPSRLVLKRRIFLKDSSINYQTIIRKNRRKSEVAEVEPIMEEEINEIQEEQMEFNEEGVPDSMIYVEEVQIDDKSESPSDIQYISPKPVYNEETNTIILSSPEVLKNSFKNITYRYVPSQLQHVPAVIVKKEEQI